MFLTQASLSSFRRFWASCVDNAVPFLDLEVDRTITLVTYFVARQALGELNSKIDFICLKGSLTDISQTSGENGKRNACDAVNSPQAILADRLLSYRVDSRRNFWYDVHVNLHFCSMVKFYTAVEMVGCNRSKIHAYIECTWSECSHLCTDSFQKCFCIKSNWLMEGGSYLDKSYLNLHFGQSMPFFCK